MLSIRCQSSRLQPAIRGVIVVQRPFASGAHMHLKLWFSRGITSAVMAIATYFFALAAAAATLGSDSNSSTCLRYQSLPQTNLTAVWANDGLDKVAQEEIRVKQASCYTAKEIKAELSAQSPVANSVW